MELLVCVISDPGLADEVIQALVEIGVTGATIIDSHGMGQLLLHRIPIFAGFRSLLAGSSSHNKTIFSVIREPEKAELAISAIQRVCGEFDQPHKGIIFTLPVNRAVGLTPEE